MICSPGRERQEMNHYVTGATIKALREKYRMTQAELAEKLCVSDKAVSKWETGRGFPDVSLLEALGRELHVSVPELLCGQTVENRNRSANMLKSVFYVCPHRLNAERVEDEIYVSSGHPMEKDHYLSFIAYMTQDRCETKALYPEGNAEGRFFFRGKGWLYFCCNRHGLFRQRIG